MLKCFFLSLHLIYSAVTKYLSPVWISIFVFFFYTECHQTKQINQNLIMHKGDPEWTKNTIISLIYFHFITFHHFDIDLFVCFGSLSCCMSHLHSNFSSQTDDPDILLYNSLMLSRIHGSWQGPNTSRHPQTIPPPPPCLTVSVRFLLCLDLVRYNKVHIIPTFRFIYPQNIVPELLRIIQLLLGTTWDVFIFFLVSNSFRPASSLFLTG